ncbi:hypothetical protein D3C72_1018650 [compost metagenome]
MALLIPGNPAPLLVEVAFQLRRLALPDLRRPLFTASLQHGGISQSRLILGTDGIGCLYRVLAPLVVGAGALKNSPLALGNPVGVLLVMQSDEVGHHLAVKGPQFGILDVAAIPAPEVGVVSLLHQLKLGRHLAHEPAVVFVVDGMGRAIKVEGPKGVPLARLGGVAGKHLEH